MDGRIQRAFLTLPRINSRHCHFGTPSHTGEMVCVADFTTPPNLKLVDLRSPRKMVSPFLLEDAADIGRMRSDLPFLERLGDELTRPVVPQSAAIDYTPSQYLCEFIKKCGLRA